MREVTLLSLCLLGAACGRGEKHRAPKFSDAEMRNFQADMPGMTNACLETLKWGGIEALPNRLNECFKFDRPRRWEGIWWHSMENSTFCPAPARDCPEDPERELWLDFSGAKPPAAVYPPGGTFAVEFIGRRNVGGGAFGHFGMFRNQVIVDRLISLKQIEPPPKASPRGHSRSFSKTDPARRSPNR